MTKLSTNDRDKLAKQTFAFPKERKEPLENASHVRNAVARFNQVKDVTDTERDEKMLIAGLGALRRIKTAARKHGVEITEKSWREIGSK